MLTNTHAYLEEDDVIKHEKESGWKTGIFIIKLVCRALPEDLGRRHDAREMQSSGREKWGEENRHIAELVLN